jgi:translation initiation factor IF-1
MTDETQAGGSRIPMEDLLTVEGVVLKVLPGTMFHVALPNKHQVLAHISGKMRKRFIRLNVGDRVRMEMTPYDLAKARIVYRLS